MSDYTIENGVITKYTGTTALFSFPIHDIIDTNNGEIYLVAIKRWNHET